jgi:hypothetical protein
MPDPEQSDGRFAPGGEDLLKLAPPTAPGPSMSGAQPLPADPGDPDSPTRPASEVLGKISGDPVDRAAPEILTTGDQEIDTERIGIDPDALGDPDDTLGPDPEPMEDDFDD